MRRVPDRIHTTFVDSKTYPTGLVSLKYQVRKAVSSALNID